MTYRIKNWGKLQHFKDRRPPWIKLYREDVLDDPDWHELDGDTAKALIMLTALASEDQDLEGKLPDVRTMAFRLRVSETKINHILTKISKWVIQDDISAISERYQLDAPETETETETETQPLAEKPALDSGFEKLWVAYPKKIGKGAAETAFKKAKINGHLSEVLIALESQKKTEQWTKENRRYVPNPATWINQKRWLDEPEPPRQQSIERNPWDGAI